MASVYRQFRRWTLAGLWESVLNVLNGSGSMPDQVQMIDQDPPHHQRSQIAYQGGNNRRQSF